MDYRNPVARNLLAPGNTPPPKGRRQPSVYIGASRLYLFITMINATPPSRREGELVPYVRRDLQSRLLALQAPREADQVGTDTEGGALSCRNPHRGAHSVKDGEDNRSEDGQGGDLIHRKSLAGDKQGCRSNDQTLNQIFDHTIYNFSDSVVHLYTCN